MPDMTTDQAVEALVQSANELVEAWQALARAEKHRSDWSDTTDERKHIESRRSALRAAIAAALAAERERALEDAAQLCESMGRGQGFAFAEFDCAQEIRAMKAKEEGK